jgi:hypothetical protein
MENTIGSGTTEMFVREEFKRLDLKDKRLNERAKKILMTIQTKLGSCIRRLFLDAKEARQAYDFF